METTGRTPRRRRAAARRADRRGRRRGMGPGAGLRAAVAAGAVALLAAACGAVPGSGGGGRNATEYASCMRSHGVPDFPDPENGGFQMQGNPSHMTVNGVTLQESQAQLQAAQQACQTDLGTPTNAGPASPQRQAAAVAYGACIRSHGFPTFPDPKVTANSFAVHVPPGVNRQSPQFQAAQLACQRLIPAPPRGPKL